MYINNMSVANSAFVEPLPLEGFIFGPDFVLQLHGPILLR
jgi:hypothetical protein